MATEAVAAQQAMDTADVATDAVLVESAPMPADTPQVGG